MKLQILTIAMLFFCSGAYCAVPAVVEKASQSISSSSRSPKNIAKLVGSIGAAIAPHGEDLENPGHNNGPEFAKEFLSVLGSAETTCVGFYDNDYDKVSVFFKAPGIDWSKSNLKATSTDKFALHFYRSPNTKEAWQLIWVTPVIQKDIELYGGITVCEEQK